MNKIIHKITITGPNQKTDIEKLYEISKQYPFVEWGILLSKNSMGSSPRYPNRTWMTELAGFKAEAINSTYAKDFILSGHLCGRWVRDVCKGEWSFLEDLGETITDMFNRIQLNFHAEVQRLPRDEFIHGFRDGPGRSYSALRQFIFQMDDVNNSILDIAWEAGVNVSPLFDLSGGAGILPENWPKANGYCGYAGGLSPENVQEQLAIIEQAANENLIWIDVETHVRSDNDKIFDLDKVKAFIENALPWVIGGERYASL